MTSTLMNIEADKCQEVLRWLFISQGRVMKQLSQALASKDEMFSEGTINYERQTRRLIHWTTHNIISLINLPHGNPRYAESDKSFGQMESGEPGHIGPLPPCQPVKSKVQIEICDTIFHSVKIHQTGRISLHTFPIGHKECQVEDNR